MLKQRVLTALILGPLVIWTILAAAEIYYVALLVLIVLIGAQEWSVMARLQSASKAIYILVVAGLLYTTWYFMRSNESFSLLILLLGCAWWLSAFVMLKKYNSGKHDILSSPVIRSVIGLFLLLPMFVALVELRAEAQYGPIMVMYMMMLIWIADSAAYFSGKKWGKTKLLPNVSPGKTWQGVAGAIVGSILFSIAYTFYDHGIQGEQAVIFVVISLVTVIFSIHGDLVESMFKRQAGIKDSGKILPGHGGILDRVDSLTSAAPVFVTLMLLFGVKL